MKPETRAALAKLKIDKIYASELKRAQETAKPISDILEMEFKVENRFFSIHE